MDQTHSIYRIAQFAEGDDDDDDDAILFEQLSEAMWIDVKENH